MTPSVAQLRKWSEVSEDGAWVRIPSSAFTDVLWMLTVFERIEDNKHVQDAFSLAADEGRGE